MSGGRPDASAPAARAAAPAVAPAHAWTALEPPLVLLGPGHPQPEGRRARAFVPDPDVVDLAPALHLAPTVREQVLVPSGGTLAELLRVRHLEEQALDADLLVVGHGGKRSRAGARDPVWTRPRRGTVDSRRAIARQIGRGRPAGRSDRGRRSRRRRDRCRVHRGGGFG